MLFCDQCGNQLKDGAKFCSKCGNPISSDRTPTTQEYDDIRSSGDSSRPTDFHIPSRQQLRQETYLPPVDLSKKVPNDNAFHNNVPKPKIRYDKNNPPPVIKTLAKKLSKKAGIEIFLIAVCIICIGILLSGGETDSDDMIYVIIFGAISFWNFCVTCSDLWYKRKMLLRPVGIVEHYEKQIKQFLLPNISFGFALGMGHKSNTYSIHHYVLLNRESLDEIEKCFLAEENTDELSYDELDRIRFAFNAAPQESKETKVRMEKDTIAICIGFVIAAVLIIVLSSYVSQEDEISAETNEVEGTFAFTAEEYIGMYNQSSSLQAYDKEIDFSTAIKGKNDTDDYYYCFYLNNRAEVVVLFVEGQDYDNPLNCIKFSHSTNSEDDEIPIGLINEIQAIYGDLSYDDVETIAENAKKSGTFTPSQSPDIYLYYKYSSEDQTEAWYICPNTQNVKPRQVSLVSQSDESEQSIDDDISETASSEPSITVSETDDNGDPLSFTAKEFIDKYNTSAVKQGVEQFDFTEAIKDDLIDPNHQILAYELLNHNNDKFFSLYLEENSYESNVGIIYLAVNSTSSDYTNIPPEMTNAIIAIFNDCSYTDAYHICQTAKEQGNTTDEKIPDVIIGFSSEYNDYEVWSILLPNQERLLTLIDNLYQDMADTSSVADTSSTAALPSGTIYSDRIQKYNGTVYYSSVFSAQGDSGFFDFSSTNSSYQKLPIPSDSIQIDSFVIVNDTVFFADRQSGTGSYMPSALYQMNLDGTGLTKITDNVDINFKYENGTIKLSVIDPGTGKPSINNHYVYDIADNRLTSESYYIDTERSNTILPYKGTSSSSEFDGGTFYIGYEYVTVNNRQYNMVYYRQDTSTGQNNIVGYAFNPAA